MDSLIKIPIDDVLELLAEYESEIIALSISATDKIQREITITLADLLELSDQYYYRVAIAARMFLRGDRHITI